MVKCPWCGTVFPNVPEEGGCPRCGGPELKPVESTVVERVIREYVYVTPTSASPYYVPQRPTFTQKTFTSLGFRRAIVLFVLLAILAVVLLWEAFWYIGKPDSNLTNPELQNAIPTEMIATNDSVGTRKSLKEEHSWMNPVDALALRDQENVVNLVWVEDGGVLYSAKSSIIFQSEDYWINDKPFWIDSLTPAGTGFQMRYDGRLYDLNILQPFVVAFDPETVYIVDMEGVLWHTPLDNVEFISLDEAKEALPAVIAPNPNLSLSFTK